MREVTRSTLAKRDPASVHTESKSKSEVTQELQNSNNSEARIEMTILLFE